MSSKHSSLKYVSVTDDDCAKLCNGDTSINEEILRIYLSIYFKKHSLIENRLVQVFEAIEFDDIIIAGWGFVNKYYQWREFFETEKPLLKALA